MAKVDSRLLEEKHDEGNLILVTAITPTKAGIGKTTVSIGLALGLNKIGKKAFVALREPSLGPVFGMKGGAAGGGYAQVLPMDRISLHFTGDFRAITSANNTLAALVRIIMHIKIATNPEGLSSIVWKRVASVNDRSLRNVVTGLGVSLMAYQERRALILPLRLRLWLSSVWLQTLGSRQNRLDNIFVGLQKRMVRHLQLRILVAVVPDRPSARCHQP